MCYSAGEEVKSVSEAGETDLEPCIKYRRGLGNRAVIFNCPIGGSERAMTWFLN